MRLLVDTDTASDDAVALMLAGAATGDVALEAITIVAGNVPAATGARNALTTLDLMGLDVPVYIGRTEPLSRRLQTAQHVHGTDGMGDSQFPAPARIPCDDDAVDVIIALAAAHPGEVTLVTLGPFTNLAAAHMRDPTTLAKFRSIYCMAGSIGRGNITQLAEYNVWCDPEAAAVVLASGVPLTFVGCDVSRESTGVTSERLNRWRSMSTARADFVVAVTRGAFRWSTDRGLDQRADLPDPLAMAVALDPSIVTSSETVHAEISLERRTRGRLLVRPEAAAGPPTVTIVTAVDVDAFWARVESMVADDDAPLTWTGATR